MRFKTSFAILVIVVLQTVAMASVFTPTDVLNTKKVYEVDIRPDGKWIAYTVYSTRPAEDEAGSAYRELHVVSTETSEIRPFITGDISVSSISWSPDGSHIAFRDKRGDNKFTQVWAIPFTGGEARQLTHAESSVMVYRWHPDSRHIAYVAETPKTECEKTLEDKGYDFIYFEENLKDRNLYLYDLETEETRQLTEGVSVWDVQFNHAGDQIAVAASPLNLVDHSYMFKKIYLVDVAGGDMRQLTDNEGKLENFAFSPDDSKLVYNAALELKDHAASQAFVIDVQGGEPVNLTPDNFRGHVEWVGWQSNKRVLYRASEGVWKTLNTVPVGGGERDIIYDAQETKIVMERMAHTPDAKQFAFYGSSATVPGEVFYWQPGEALQQLTNHNPWIADRTLGQQDVIRYKARDGQEIEGLLIYPVDYQEGQQYPLIVNVHGGPEAHFSNNWTRTTRYSIAGQVLAGRGFAVFYPNYRASTGYGVEFGAAGYQDAAGVEFDDIADGIDYLVEQGIADADRVGLGGGSYGGFASAWFASYYTDKVRAVCMFVGISNLISKRGTTDIPYEEMYVHSGRPLEEMWEFSLKRSPIYYAHQSKTAVLIAGGADDPRVHPAQSLEFYRRLKMNDHPAVRLVQYPGEGHGNARQPGRIDYLYRHLQWYDWYVKEAKPLDGPMPPLDLSEHYGLELD